MGRYKYDKFLMRFSKDVQNAIKADITGHYNISVDDYDGNAIDIRVKRANRAQRHRFAETIKKLEAFYNSDEGKCFTYNYEGEIDTYISASHFSEITGRNRKTVTDWIAKGFIESRGFRFGCINIAVQKTIENLKKM